MVSVVPLVPERFLLSPTIYILYTMTKIFYLNSASSLLPKIGIRSYSDMPHSNINTDDILHEFLNKVFKSDIDRNAIRLDKKKQVVNINLYHLFDF